MKKIEKINSTIEDLISYYEELDYENQKIFNRICWDTEEMKLQFYEGHEKGREKGYENGVELRECEAITLGIAGYFKYNEAILVYALLSDYGRIYYRAKKLCKEINKSEITEEFEKHIQRIGKSIREKALSEELEKVKNFNCEKFCDEFQQLITLGIKALYHKNDKIGKITFKINPKEGKELKEIRRIYEQLKFFEDKIVFYDCIMEQYAEVPKNDSRKLQYMACCVFIDIYTSSILWLRKEDPSQQWCPKVPWQLLEAYRMLLDKFFGNVR